MTKKKTAAKTATQTKKKTAAKTATKPPAAFTTRQERTPHMSKQIFGAGVLTIGISEDPTDEFQCQVGAFTVTASSNLQPIPATLCSGPSQAASASSFSCMITYMQDWGEASSLSQLLWDNDAKKVFFKYVPEDATVSSITGACWAVAGDYGGEGAGLWVNSSDMPCTDRPVITSPG